MSFRVRAVVTASVGLVAVLSISGCTAASPDPASTAAPSSSSATLPNPTQSGTTPTGKPSSTPTAASSGDASIDDPASLSVVVNKTRPLNPANYAAKDLVTVPVPGVHPPTLRKDASAAVVTMFAAFAAETGLKMQSQSAYRSYSAQVSTYAYWVSSKGKAGADLTSARPGYSEHQTGLAIDISAIPNKCGLAACFADTPQGTWLAANAYKYGFILRYPKGLTDVTGYEFEPWHYRYLGIDLAQKYHDSGAQTLEGYFGLPDAPDYVN